MLVKERTAAALMVDRDGDVDRRGGQGGAEAEKRLRNPRSNFSGAAKNEETMATKFYAAADCSPGAIRARIILICNERKIAEAEIEKVLASDLRSPVPGDVLMQFVEDHDISTDWLFLGDLRGLQRMRRPSECWV